MYLSNLLLHPSQGLLKSASSKANPETKMPTARRWKKKNKHL